MFQTIDSNMGSREKQSTVLKERMLRIAGMAAAALFIFGVLYVGLLMIE